MAEIDAALDNVRAAWDWAVAGRQSELLSPAVAPLSLFYEIRGNYREAEQLFGETAAVFDRYSGLDDPLSLRLHAHEMRAKVRLAEYETALAALRRLKPLAEAAGNSGISGLIRLSLAEIMWRQSNYAESAQLLKQNLDSESLLDYPDIIASTHFHFGTIEAFTGNLEKSLTHLSHAEAHWIAENNLRRLAQLLNNKGMFLEEFGFFEEAKVGLEKALELNIGIEDIHAKANIFHNLGNVSIALNKTKEAINYLNKSLLISLENHEKQLIPNTILVLAEAYILKGNSMQAIEEIEKSYLYFDKLNFPHFDVRAQLLLGKALIAENDIYNALPCIEKALKISKNNQLETLTKQICKEIEMLITQVNSTVGPRLTFDPINHCFEFIENMESSSH